MEARGSRQYPRWRRARLARGRQDAAAGSSLDPDYNVSVGPTIDGRWTRIGQLYSKRSWTNRMVVAVLAVLRTFHATLSSAILLQCIVPLTAYRYRLVCTVTPATPNAPRLVAGQIAIAARHGGDEPQGS